MPYDPSDSSVNQLSPVGILMRFSSQSSLVEGINLYFLSKRGRSGMLSCSMPEVPTATNMRSGVILFSAYVLVVVDPILKQVLVSCVGDSMPI